MKLTLKQIANIHKVLCDEVRLSIMEYIKTHNGVTTVDILSKFKIDPSTLSFHLAKMESCNLIKKSKRGKFIVYKINKSILNDTHKYMENVIDAAIIKNFESVHDEYFKLNTFVDIYKLYADPIRLKIWKTICENPGISGKELAIITKQSEANLSFHLNKLIKYKIINTKKSSNQHLYWLDIGYAIAFHLAVAKARNEK